MDGHDTKGGADAGAGGRADAASDARTSIAETSFHDALLRARSRHEPIEVVEAAAAEYCVELKRQGYPPERMLRDAKRVISQAIDGEDARVAEHAVQSCIRNYYRPD